MNPNKNLSPKIHHKKRLTHEQVMLLEASFDGNKKLEPEKKLRLSRELGVPPRQIAIWYQNKRARWKNQSLEVDYNTLQIRLESALAEKKDLEKQVRDLQGELKRAREMLMVVDGRNTSLSLSESQRPASLGSSLESCDEGVGCNSSLQEDGSCCLGGNYNKVEDQVVYQLDELYACWIGSSAAAAQGGASSCGGSWQFEQNFWG